MEFIKYTFDYPGEVVDLLNICFPDKKISNQTFSWKHFDDYFKNKSVAMLAIENSKVCAFVCFTPLIITDRQSIDRVFYSCAVQATHPDYRRRGLVTNLTKMIEDQLDPNTSFLGFSNEDGIKIDKYSKKINYQIMGQLSSKYILSLPYATDIKVLPVSKISDDCYQRTHLFHINKNMKYLQWRYSHNPKSPYKCFKLIQKSNIIGCIYCKESRFKYNVSDLILAQQTPESSLSAIKAFSRYALSKGRFVTSYSYLNNDFWKRSFPTISLTKKIPIYFTIKSIETDALQVDNWLIQGGDVQ